MKNVTIRNATFRTVLVPCNSGRNLFISPRGTSAEISESEVRPNARVEKLLDRKAIVLKPATSASRRTPLPETRRAPRRKKESEPAKP